MVLIAWFGLLESGGKVFFFFFVEYTQILGKKKIMINNNTKEVWYIGGEWEKLCNYLGIVCLFVFFFLFF